MEDGNPHVINPKFAYPSFNTINPMTLCFIYCRKQESMVGGYSILKHAHLEAFLRPGGLHLNLARENISKWWQGYSGLKLSNRAKA